jgi:uncharacterized sporulation protein YeaH/YhbH (DUF444 family)
VFERFSLGHLRESKTMDFRRVFRRRERVRSKGLDAASDVNVTVAANLGRPGSVTRVTSRQRATAAASTSERPPKRPDEAKDETAEDPSTNEERGGKP